MNVSEENPPIKMLTIGEAGKLIQGLTTYRIRQMVISGELPCVRAGKKYLICQNVLVNIICNPCPVVNQQAGIRRIDT